MQPVRGTHDLGQALIATGVVLGALALVMVAVIVGGRSYHLDHQPEKPDGR